MILGVAATLGGFYLLYRVLTRYDPDELLDALGAVAWERVGFAVLFTVGAFLCLIALEYLAVSYTRHKVPLRHVARTTVAALGIGHSLGLAALSSGGVRYRMYQRHGLKVKSVGEIIFFSAASVAVGVGALGGAALLWHGEVIGSLLGIPVPAIRTVAFAAWGFVAVYIVLCALAKPVTIKSRTFRLPSWKTACGQTVLSALKYLCVAGVLYVLVDNFADTDYPTVAALFVGADLSALLAHVPGGWGLHEYIITTALPGAGVFLGVLAFRGIYYLLPLFVGLGIFIHDEWAGVRAHRRTSGPPEARGA